MYARAGRLALVLGLSYAWTGPLSAARQADSGFGSIEGVVRVTDAALPSPSSTRVENTTDPDVCGREHDLEDLVVSPDYGLAHATVVVVGPAAERIRARPPRRLVLDNRDCRFAPHVAVAVVGDTIVATNGDSTLHTTHYYGALRANVSLPARGVSSARVARETGIVSVLCDVHGWMRAFIRVDAHPYHAVSDGDGRFRVDGIPTGTYTLEVWHETLGALHVPVTIRADSTAAVEVEYR